ncbi:MAG: beta-propeller domain-containing protein [Acutalibacteraceae bacterium]
MKNSEKQTLELLKNELQKSTQSAKIPLKLQKESIVAMLNEEKKEKDFSDRTGTQNKSISVIRRMTVAAAMLVLVVGCTLFMRANSVRVIKADTFNEGNSSVSPVKSVNSYEEIENAVRSILNKETTSPAVSQSPENENTTQNRTQSGVIDRLREGYNKYIGDSSQNTTEVYVNAQNPSPEAYVASSNAVAAVDNRHADIVKTDGDYIYIVTTGRNAETGKTVEQVKIIKAVPADEMKTVSTIDLSDRENGAQVSECLEIHVKDNILVALMSRYSYAANGSASGDSTAALFYDISDPNSPVKLREHVQDGSYVSSSFHGSGLCISTAKTIESDSSGSELIPAFSVNGAEVRLSTDEIIYTVNDPTATFLFITVTDISDFGAKVGRFAILGGGTDISYSANSIAVTRGFVSVDADENGARESKTEIYRFSVNNSTISFVGSYTVQGALCGGISFDESNGYLRAATSVKGATNIYVLNEKMEFVSGLKGIFPGETVKNIKFIGSKGYIVSGKSSEKTMIIDFSDYSKPKVAGTIETNGFTGEFYAVSDSMILTVSGFKNNNGGNNSVKLTLFDVSNPDSPKAVSSLEYNDGEYLLPLEGDGRSVIFSADGKLFGFPVVKIYRNEDGPELQTSAYVLYKITDKGIEEAGKYKHFDYEPYVGDAAVRGTCIGGTLYTVSGEKVVAFSISDSSVVSSIAL